MPSAPRADEPPAGERLQKVLAAAGFGSRRACEELIAAGRVEVDGRRVTEQGVRVDPARSVVRVDGERVATKPGLEHLALNKPRGVVSSMHDERGRPDLSVVAGERATRLFHVGRLDADTEGLLLLTNDGDLAHRLAHPRYEVAKTYVAQVNGPVSREALRALRRGVELDDGPAKVDAVRILGTAGSRVLLEVTLHEGRKHIVRRLLDAVGHPVLALVRTRLGPVVLGDLRPGRTRRLRREEVSALYREVGL